jgi:hypothetical protein
LYFPLYLSNLQACLRFRDLRKVNLKYIEESIENFIDEALYIFTKFISATDYNLPALAKEEKIDISWVVVPALGSLSSIMKRPSTHIDCSRVIGDPKENLDHAEEEAKNVANRLNSKWF